MLKFIPQRYPVVMIDTLIDCNEKETRTSLTIEPDNMFSENGIFTEAGLMENIAQTAASKVGYECMLLNKPVPPGFIGAVKNLQVFQFPKVGDTINTRISIENEVFGITLISGSVFLNGQEIASAEMKIVLNGTTL
ncbi:MAG: 3-hydroxyacyl-ACP dehydratase [Opitutaceae bacterium]|nr:3-hydroxyacyl-ACP dehydratase [Cytophagales bacterium]